MQLWIVVLLVSAIIFLIELFARSVLAQLPFRFAVPKSTLVVHRHPNVSDELPETAISTFGAHGLRPDFADHSNRVDILLVGGSVIECLFLSDDDSIVGQLNRELRSNVPEGMASPVALAAGKSGWRFHEARRFLDHFSTDRKIRDLVIHCGSSDILHWCARGCGTVTESSRHSSDSSIFAQHPITSGWRPSSLAIVHAARLAKRNLSRKRVASNVGNKIIQERTRRLTAPKLDKVDGFESVCEFAEAEARLLFERSLSVAENVTFIPQFYYYKGEYTNSEELMLWCGAVGSEKGDHQGFLSPALLASLLAELNFRISNIARETGVNLIDMSGRIPLRPAYFYDDFHLTAAGAREFSSTLSELLLRGRLSHELRQGPEENLCDQ